MTGPVLEPRELAWVEEALREAAGITFAPGARDSLASSVTGAAGRLGLGVDAFLAELRRRDEAAVAALVDHAVVPETYFFRHPEHFRALTRFLLPSLADRRALRIWSAGCATGEEPYSLAIALLASGRRTEEDAILGTDISPRLLARARVGRYGRWSFRQFPATAPGGYLREVDGAMEVGEEVRRPVTFRRHNLVAEPPPWDACDLVVCRNVLIYFDPELARRVLEGLATAVAPGGWLMLGPAETPLGSEVGLERVQVEGTTLFRRAAAGARPLPASRPSRVASAPAARPPAIPVRDASSPAPSPASPTSPAAAARDPARSSPAPDPRAPPPSSPARDPRPAAGRALAGAAAGDASATAYARALAAAEAGRLDEALSLAREAGAALAAPPHHLLALLAETAGDHRLALEAIRRALYLDPGDPLAHATAARLHSLAGREEDARRARTNALLALGERADDELLPGPAPITAGALRRALGR